MSKYKSYLPFFIFFVSTILSANDAFSQTCNPRWNRTKSLSCDNYPIQFEANSPGRTTFEWDFGDSTGSTGSGSTITFRDPVHAFAKPGIYVVTFKGSGGAGACTDTVVINIKESPKVHMRRLNAITQAFEDNKFCFVDSSQAVKNSTLSRIKYEFGNGISTLTITNPKGQDTFCHHVNDPKGGCFNLTIEASDINGCTNIARHTSIMCVLPEKNSIPVNNNALKSFPYPNPVNDVLSVNLANSSTIKIYSSIGQLLYNHSFESGIAQIDLNDFKSANYFLEIHNGTSVTRHIIQVK